MRIFVGGATGATGREFVAAARAAGVEQVVHVRPRSESKYRALRPDGPEPALLELTDAGALDAAMAGCDAVVSMIGTMRVRFAQGDTYASSDVGTTQLLVDAARRAEVGHFVLMGAVGTGWLPGAYYDAKRRAEQIVIDSGLPWTITRPAALVGEDRGSRLVLAGGWLGGVPGLRGIVDDARGIPCEVVARAMLRVAVDHSHVGEVLTGRDLWRIGGPTYL